MNSIYIINLEVLIYTEFTFIGKTTELYPLDSTSYLRPYTINGNKGTGLILTSKGKLIWLIRRVHVGFNV